MKQRFNNKRPEKKRRDHDETLRAENRQLRKQVAQLQKEIKRLQVRDEDVRDLVEELSRIETEQERIEAIPRCKKCNSHHIKILVKLKDDIDYFICDACGSRGPLK